MSEGPRVRGVFPGGPGRPADEDRQGRAYESFEERVARKDQSARERRRRRKRRNAALAVTVAALVAGAVGFALGGRLPEPVAQAPQVESSRGAMDRAISREVNRMLLELWKMEQGELGNGSLGTR